MCVQEWGDGSTGIGPVEFQGSCEIVVKFAQEGR